MLPKRCRLTGQGETDQHLRLYDSKDGWNPTIAKWAHSIRQGKCRGRVRAAATREIMIVAEGKITNDLLRYRVRRSRHHNLNCRSQRINIKIKAAIKSMVENTPRTRSVQRARRTTQIILHPVFNLQWSRHSRKWSIFVLAIVIQTVVVITTWRCPKDHHHHYHRRHWKWEQDHEN